MKFLHMPIKLLGRFEIQLHANRNCFYAGLKSQTGMGSLRHSYERTLSCYQGKHPKKPQE